MGETNLRLEKISFAFDGMTAPLLDEVTLNFPRGWTGIVGPNGSGKTTLLTLAMGDLKADRGHMHTPKGIVAHCPQRTDEPPEVLGGLIASATSQAWKLRSRLGVEDDFIARWPSLSHGQRKRAQIAAALWLDPLVLCVDEPTNHLDASAREMLKGALLGFGGIGLLVSHDRNLLNSLCIQCVFMLPPKAIPFPGNYSQASRQAGIEALAKARQYQKASEKLAELERESSRRRGMAARAHARRSKRKLAQGDADGREKINRARVSGQDGARGRLLNQMEGRLSKARIKLEEIDYRKPRPTGIELPYEAFRGDVLFRLPAGHLTHEGGFRLEFPELVMLPGDRVALDGPNGGGKTSLLGHILAGLTLPEDKILYLPQELSATASTDVLGKARLLDSESLGRVMNIISRLGSQPARLLESRQPSPGETRKLLLALGMAKSPWLMILDEPTNHLDLVSIEALQNALADIACGLVLISHDSDFVEALSNRFWWIKKRQQADNGYILEVQ